MMDVKSAGVHDQGMNVAYISALSALAGSVVGGLISGIATWLSVRVQTRAGDRAHDKLRREDLYRDFVVAAAKAYGVGLISNEPKIEEIVALYSMITRMRILSEPRIVACAENILATTLDTYFAPNKTISELHDLMKSGGGRGLDLLKDFGELAREELRTL